MNLPWHLFWYVFLLPRYLEPNRSGWLFRLISIQRGEADERITEPDARMVADDRYLLLKAAHLVRQGLTGVSKPLREDDGYVIHVGLTNMGERAIHCLKQGLVWNTAGQTEDIEATRKYWRRQLAEARYPDEDVFDRIGTYAHPWLEPVLAEVEPRLIALWIGCVRDVTEHDDPFFKKVMELPDHPYAVVKAEAFQRRIEIWKPS
ncbi:MAG: hypothetical protein EOO77_24885 [Oxalobacteraceae bacterium]|nr:MAG: hypothetical protein EOO77_24885 [Oxalobacteraceae bacterium]